VEILYTVYAPLAHKLISEFGVTPIWRPFVAGGNEK